MISCRKDSVNRCKDYINISILSSVNREYFMHTIKFLLLCLLIATHPALAQSLPEVIALTLKSNPVIQSSSQTVKAAEAMRRQAVAGYLPVIDLTLASGTEYSDNSTTRSMGTLDDRFTRTDRSISITQLLYDGASTSNLVKQQEAVLVATEARLAQNREMTSLQAVQAYVELIRLEKIVELAQGNLLFHIDTLDKINTRFETGVGTKVDVVQTQGRKAQSESNLHFSKNNAMNARARFFNIVGENARDLVMPEEGIELPLTLEQAIQLAYGNNKQILAAEADVQAAKAANERTRANFKPRLDLKLGATRNDNIDGVMGPNDDETAVVKMSYNLYRGGADRAKRNEAQAREFAARETLRSIKNRVVEEITVFWNDNEDIKARLTFLKAHVDATEEVLEVYKEQLTLGKRSLLDVLDVQNELLRAQASHLSGEINLRLAQYRLLASTSSLLTHFNLQ